jgi:hypothetical protein
LMDSDWEFKSPLVSVRVLPRIESLPDQAPILLTTRLPLPQRRRLFKFKFGWLNCDGFLDIVKFVWDKPVAGNTPIQRWNNKLCSMRRHLDGWARQ